MLVKDKPFFIRKITTKLQSQGSTWWKERTSPCQAGLWPLSVLWHALTHAVDARKIRGGWLRAEVAAVLLPNFSWIKIKSHLQGSRDPTPHLYSSVSQIKLKRSSANPSCALGSSEHVSESLPSKTLRANRGGNYRNRNFFRWTLTPRKSKRS